MAVDPFMKVTEPVGVFPLTVAEKVTAWESADGLAEEVRAVLLGVWPTTWTTIPEVDVRLLASPL